MDLNANSYNNFQKRHIGINEVELQEMLQVIEADSLDNLIDETIPTQIRKNDKLKLDEALSEHEYLSHIREVSKKNDVFRSYIGLGYHNSITPGVILRNIFENPGWYTQYTPYQAEISQGRLEALLNFQTMIADLTGMEIANASLLDEGTAAAEAMTMFDRLRSRKAKNATKFYVSEKCFPQTIEVLQTRAEPIGIEIIVCDHNDFVFDETVIGALLQYPAEDGNIFDYSEIIQKAHDKDAFVVVAADILSLAILKPPGEFGADVVVGNSQRFGVPLGFGGPHAAFFATKSEFIRSIPGRIIGVSKDSQGNNAYRMTLQTREQHIRRDKATSNICTAQALLAIIAGMYAVYHGPKGIKLISQVVHNLTSILESELKKLGFKISNGTFFDTLRIETENAQELIELADEKRINFRFVEHNILDIALNETTTLDDISEIISIFAKSLGKVVSPLKKSDFENVEFAKIPDNLKRTSEFLTHPVFNTHHSETQMLRYIKSLENKDLSLTSSMISLGSCTMKLNATSEMIPLSWSEFSDIHPFAPLNQANGYYEIIKNLEKDLTEITGFDSTSLQPNSGAQGEYAGLMVIRAYQKDIGQEKRNIVLIPSSAHGTNPASAVMAGMKVIVVKCDENGNIDIEDLRAKAIKHKNDLSALMVTYPSTHGVFEEGIKEICAIVHENGGQVYMDGANMNAQVGLTSPAIIGADVCHLNLHKTFAIPHGGGGPGMGPICVAKHLSPYLPSHSLLSMGGEKAISAISAAPWGSPSILLISYGYIKMLGKEGVLNSTKYAILNANYIKSRLENHYKLLYGGTKGRVAHEMIFDFREFKKFGIEVEDIAKRLMDYGFHAPTISFPVAGTIMIEPTESEDKAELDRFCDTLISIREEIREVEEGKADTQNNILKNAPHTSLQVTSDEWNFDYSRQKAAFPLPHLKENKFWTPVSRIDNTFGDRNIMCSCPPIEDYS